MDLIIKPTGRCNFNCTFCSASELRTGEDPCHVHQKMKEYIEEVKPQSIIITGGDPLMMEPSFYYELREIVGNKVNLSATTNMKNFYLHPDKWKELLSEDWFSITTSFQYGNGRMWDKNTVYDEELFIKVMNKYHECVPNKPLPSFISVIGYDNEQYAVDHVRLAKRLGTVAKLNAVLPVGRGSQWYPRYKMYQIYLDIIDVHGLEEYEANCIERYFSKCPKNNCNTCNYHIRCCYIGTDDELHVGVCDEMIAIGEEITDDDRKYCRNEIRPVNPNEFITPQCSYCQLCMLCNGCNLNRKYAKTDPNYCDEMKKLEDRIVATGWAL